MATMTTVTTAPGLTYVDLDFVPKEREGDRHELFDGELIVTPSPVPDHERLTIRLAFQFGDAVWAGLGEVFTAPIDVKFRPGIVAVPDLVFVSRERLGIVGRTAINGAPDLIVEILSPSTHRRDLGQKKALYERFGVREYWVVDPRARSVAVFVLRAGRYKPLPIAGGVVRSTVVPGLAVDVAALFHGL